MVPQDTLVLTYYPAGPRRRVAADTMDGLPVSETPPLSPARDNSLSYIDGRTPRVTLASSYIEAETRFTCKGEKVSLRLTVPEFPIFRCRRHTWLQATHRW